MGRQQPPKKAPTVLGRLNLFRETAAPQVSLRGGKILLALVLRRDLAGHLVAFRAEEWHCLSSVPSA